MIANSLFHFTQKLDTLKIILESKRLRAAINLEEISEISRNYQYVSVPMICFCDIPLKFIKVHVERYGEYGIGFTKEWALKNNINPIIYYHNKSVISKVLSEFYQNNEHTQYELKNLNIYSNDPIVTNSVNNILFNTSKNSDALKNLASMTKTFMSSPNSGRKKQINNYIDREWRYLPNLENYSSVFTNSYELREKLNRDYWKKPDYLKFNVNDIEHLVIKSRKDITKITSIVQNLKINENEKFRLMQKVSDWESIDKDM